LHKFTSAWSLAFILALSLHSLPAQAAKAPAAKSPAAPTCEPIMLSPIGTGEDFSRLTETHSLLELVDPDPAKNLAYQHPSIVMRSAQNLLHLVQFRAPRRTRDSTYRLRPLALYPVFSDFIPEAGYRGIVGQLDAIDEIADYIKTLAHGQKTSHVPQLTGPAGTGKTEALIVLDRLGANLAARNPDFYRYTYLFKNLKSIPELRYVPENFRTLPGSPYLLLPESYQRAVVQFAAPRVREAIGTDPLPFELRDAQTQYIMDKIIAHMMRETGIKNPNDHQVLLWPAENYQVPGRQSPGPPALF
jgi:hypothetical protein